MEGVTTAIVAFIFVCILYPRLVKNPAQFYTAFGMIVLMLLFHSLAGIFTSEKFWGFVRGLNGLLQLVALVLVVLSTGGLSLRELTGEFANAFEVIRRGESEKEVIVPLTGEVPKPRRRPVVMDEDDDLGGVGSRKVQTIETPVAPPPAAAGGGGVAPRREADDARIPLE
jgi:hypothetical protein